jgi:hypothetical protein
MENFLEKVDNNVATLWIETAGFTVFLSVTFLIATKLF